MRTTLLVLLVASCSAPGAPRTAPAAAPAPPVVAVALPGAAPAPITPHRCQTSVWPYYDAYAETAPAPEPEPFEAAPEQTEGDVPDEPGEDGMGGASLDDKLAEINAKRRSDGVCDTRHVEALEATILAQRTPAPATTAPKAWDRKSSLAYREAVRASLALTPEEDRQLVRDGFVVPARLAYDDYTRAYYDIHRSQLPVYVSVDSILHAIYASHDSLLASLETTSLAKRLDATLGAMHCGLASAAASYPPDVAKDVDLYLTVARSLLAGEAISGELGETTARAAAPLVEMIQEAGPLRVIQLFGRARSFDASQYTPRGHYAGSGELERYFRAAMWLSRVEFNLVSRDSRSSQPGYDPDPTETPREALVALALVDLAQRSGALADIAAMDTAWTAFAGIREDITFADLDMLRTQAGITTLDGPQTAAALRAVIADRFQRTVNVHPMPNVSRLPAITTMLGPRITVDTVALGAITDERGPALQAAEVGVLLGQDRGLAYVAQDPALHARLRAARTTLERTPMGPDLYSSWLAAIRGLAERPPGAMPSFMDGAAFADLRLDSALAAYGQLRHNHVLIAAQVYDQGGCEIPDGYVEPAPATYRALAEYAARGTRAFAALDPTDETKGGAYFARLQTLMRVLTALSHEQLANRPLSAAAKRFLAMIVERRETTAWGYGGSFPVATYDGWYLDLFPHIDTALEDASFIADYATFDRNGQQGVHYLGAKGPRLGVYVIDTGGAPRVMVGPVARAYQHTGPLDHRLDDEAAKAIAGLEPWAKSYTVAAPAELAVSVRYHRPTKLRDAKSMGPMRDRDPMPPNTARFEAPDALGEITIEYLDHHFVKMKSVKATIGKGRTDIKSPATPRPIEALRIRRGAFSGRVELALDGRGHEQFGDAGPEAAEEGEEMPKMPSAPPGPVMADP